MTPAELLAMRDEAKGYDLVDGHLRERKKTMHTNLIAGNICSAIHKAARNSGWIVTCGVGFQCFPHADRVRRADVAYQHVSRLTIQQVMAECHCVTVPNLVVEVVGPGELSNDLNEKRMDWLDAGTELIWIVFPRNQTIESYSVDGSVRLLDRTDVLTAEPVFPDFHVPVADLFKLPTDK
jgi:Uma2 family endonuclease